MLESRTILAEIAVPHFRRRNFPKMPRRAPLTILEPDDFARLTHFSKPVILPRVAPEAFWIGESMPTARQSQFGIISPQKSDGHARIISIRTPDFAVPPTGWKRELALEGAAPTSDVAGAWPLPFGDPARDVGAMARERRSYSRAKLRLPLAIVRVLGRRTTPATNLATTNVSSSGLFAELPFELEEGLIAELKIELVKPALVRSRVSMVTQARVVRVEAAAVLSAGWGTAFEFEDITFERDPMTPVRIAS